MWERKERRGGPWKPVADNKVPSGVVERYNERVRMHALNLTIIGNGYVYRYLFCV